MSKKRHMGYAETIKMLRQKLLLTQNVFAESLGVKLITLNRWKSGMFEPTMKMKRKLKVLFDENNIEIEVIR